MGLSFDTTEHTGLKEAQGDNMAKDKPSFFDVDYGIPSPPITGDGVVAVVTGSANYYGFSLVGGTSPARATIYDTVNAAGGNVIDVLVAGITSMTQSREIRVRARLGISVSITGTDMEGVVFYAPQG